MQLLRIYFLKEECRMDRQQEIHALGHEKISKLLLKFSVPCIMGLLISAFYNIVDQIFIGNSELGYLGNAATGISFPLICIANAFAWCIGDGAASFLSICAGRKDADRAHKCVGTGITVTTIISVLLAVVCLIWARPLMVLFGTSHQTVDMAVEYFRIVVAFFPFYLLMNVMNSMIRADGSPTYAMIAMLTGAVINIVLDPVFIFALKLGIAGAAWATVIGQVMSFLVCMVYFFRPKTFRLAKESFLPDGQVFASSRCTGRFHIHYPTVHCGAVSGKQYHSGGIRRALQVWTGHSHFCFQHPNQGVHRGVQYCGWHRAGRSAHIRL